MKMKARLTFVALLAALPALFAARPAAAGLDACGDINVEANAKCVAEAKGGCEALCEPVRMELACHGKLQASCEGECDVDVEASCTATCETDCVADCTVNPVSLDCRGRCEANAQADCNGQCMSSGNRSECQAACKANFEAECSASCDADLEGSVDCEAKCSASCEGECKAEVRAACQVDCQAEGFAECTSELSGGCEVECEEGEVMLFCDSNYVDHGNNLEECIEALQAVANVEVSGSASGDCSGNRCEGEAEGNVSASCALAPGQVGGASAPYGLAALGVLGLVLRRRRRS
jgi:MYXO-CTERM domain-containing protein